MAFEIRRATAADWEAVRHVRLRALADAPTAFASRIDDERARPESAWRERLDQAESATFLARVDGEVGGLVGVFLVHEDPFRAHLVSMWVAPEHRRTGIALSMVASVIDWSSERGVDEVELWVTETNEAARQLYARCGFTPSGERQPLPSNPGLPEIQMRRSLSAR